MRGRVASAALMIGLAACGHGRVAPAALTIPDPCTAPGADMTGWTEVDAGPFRFTAPPGYRRQAVQGIDSFVGMWSASRGRAVHSDWGEYSSTLDEAEAMLQGYRECRVQIGGYAARVVSGYDTAGRWERGGRKYVVAANWRNVAPGGHLTLSATAADPADLPALLSIVRSIRFDPEVR